MPILWTFQNVIFNDGGTATGSFIYDANTNTYSVVNVTTSANNTVNGNFPGASYMFVNSTGLTPTSSTVEFSTIPNGGDQTGKFNFVLAFSSPLSNAGGMDTPTGGSHESASANSTGSSFTLPARTIVDGTLQGVPAPVPEFGTIYSLGALLLFSGCAFAWKQRQRNDKSSEWS